MSIRIEDLESLDFLDISSGEAVGAISQRLEQMLALFRAGQLHTDSPCAAVPTAPSRTMPNPPDQAEVPNRSPQIARIHRPRCGTLAVGSPAQAAEHQRAARKRKPRAKPQAGRIPSAHRAPMTARRVGFENHR